MQLLKKLLNKLITIRYKIVIPIENSLAGRVADIHYLLPKYKLQIHGEHFQAVEHNLLCKPEANIR